VGIDVDQLKIQCEWWNGNKPGQKLTGIEMKSVGTGKNKTSAYESKFAAV